MFTLLRNYRAMFMMCVSSNMAQEKLTPAIDADGDGDVDMVDINRFDANTQAAIRRVLGDTNMSTLEEGRRFSLQSLIENGFVVERDATMTESTEARDTHRTSVESNTGILPIERSTFQRLIERGSRGEDVRALQNFLLQNGFNPNGVDGVFGGGTERALADYQTANGLPRSGKLSAGTTESRQSSQTLNHILGRQTRTIDTSRDPFTGAERNETAPTQQIQYPPQGREATVALQTLIGTTADGAFGPNSRRALQTFLQVRGLYSGPIDGDIGKGSNRAIKAYNEGVRGGTAESTNPKYVGGKIDKVGNKSKYQELFTNIDSQNKKIDTTFRKKITDTLQTNANNKTAITTLFKEVTTALGNDLPANISKITNWRKQRDFLNELSSIMMGGKKTNEAAKGIASAKIYRDNLRAAKSGVDAILESEGLSSSFRGQIAGAVKLAENKIASLSSANTVSYAASNKPTLTVRSQGGNRQLEAKEAGNMQIITIDNKLGQWDLGTLSMTDTLVMVENMSYTIKDLGLGNISKEQLMKKIKKGDVKIDFDMILARNCGNISFIPTVTKKPTTQVQREDGDNNNTIQVNKQPKDTSKNDGQSSNPGEENTGNNGGGGKGKGGSTGRTK